MSQERNPDIPLPSDTVTPLGNPKAFPDQGQRVLSPPQNLFPEGTYPENLQRVASRRYSNLMLEPPQLILFDTEKQCLYVELPLKLLTLSLRISLATLQRSVISTFGPCSFSHDQYCMIIGTGWNVYG